MPLQKPNLDYKKQQPHPDQGDPPGDFPTKVANFPEQLQGEVERLVYSGDETGYTVCRLKIPGQEELVTVVGNLPGIQPGERLKLTGRWLHHTKYGLQFQVYSYTSLLPATANAIRRYLSSTLVKGIGPVLAGRMVNHFGNQTLEVIENSPANLTEVPGIGLSRVKHIQKAWEAQREVREVMLFLQGNGVSSAYATRIYKTYGQEAIKIVKENPYRLAQDIRGIGFKTADKIAQQMGMDLLSPFRAQAALEHTLSEQSDAGHVFAPASELVVTCTKELDLPQELLWQGVDGLQDSGRIVREGEGVYLRGLYQAERGSADRLKVLLITPLNRRSFDPEKAVAWAQERIGLKLTEVQQQAVLMAATEKVSVLTGGPGTGKTTILKAVLAIMEALKLKVVLAAPTGRAAKRLSEATGRKARTLHRLLDFKPGEARFSRNPDNPLEADAVIIDETSMVDILLLYHLLGAIPRQTSLLLVGDVDQLPSVGPGNVLADILDSEAIPSIRLTDIFRQGERSQIVEQAHRINQGLMPKWAKKQDSDFYFIPTDDPERSAELVVQLCSERIPQKFGLDPMKDIQVLCPMNRRSIGASALNHRLQEALNPDGPAVTRFGRTFRPRDRVLQTANNYDKGVFNGELGWVSRLDLEQGKLEVAYDEAEVAYDFSELDELLPAYAMSVHRSQGSEFPAVVIPLMIQHYPMLQRNLLYTAVTRARKLAVLVGSLKAISIAVRNQRAVERHTSLDRRLGK